MQLSLDTSNVQHEKIVFQLVTPYIEGFSVPSESMEVDEPAAKSSTQTKNPNKSFTEDDDKGGKKKRKRAK